MEKDSNTDSSKESSQGSKGIMRHLGGRSGAVKIGLAASSLALIAGRTVSPGQEGLDPNNASPITPASENADVKQVSCGTCRRPRPTMIE